MDECLKRFPIFSSQAFRRRRCFGLPLTSFGMPGRFLEGVLSLVTDSRYSSTGITEALKSNFGDKTPLFGSPTGATKIAIVATTTEDSSTCIFTNYNGPEIRPQNCGKENSCIPLRRAMINNLGYKLIRPKDASSELLVWQA